MVATRLRNISVGVTKLGCRGAGADREVERGEDMAKRKRAAEADGAGKRRRVVAEVDNFHLEDDVEEEGPGSVEKIRQKADQVVVENSFLLEEITFVRTQNEKLRNSLVKLKSENRLLRQQLRDRSPGGETPGAQRGPAANCTDTTTRPIAADTPLLRRNSAMSPVQGQEAALQMAPEDREAALYLQQLAATHLPSLEPCNDATPPAAPAQDPLGVGGIVYYMASSKWRRGRIESSEWRGGGVTSVAVRSRQGRQVQLRLREDCQVGWETETKPDSLLQPLYGPWSARPQGVLWCVPHRGLLHLAALHGGSRVSVVYPSPDEQSKVWYHGVVLSGYPVFLGYADDGQLHEYQRIHFEEDNTVELVQLSHEPGVRVQAEADVDVSKPDGVTNWFVA